jgi:hypothetical protein
VEAPLCVQAAFYTQQEGRRTVAHLLNELNTTANQALPFNNHSEREETLPVFGIKVSFHESEVISAYQKPEHLPLLVEKIADGVEVTVPRLDVHSMVVASRVSQKGLDNNQHGPLLVPRSASAAPLCLTRSLTWNQNNPKADVVAGVSLSSMQP